MKERLLRLLDAEPGEGTRVVLLLAMSFFMGVFLATITVASQALFLEHFDEENDLPLALLISGAFGLVATILYNFFQNRISYTALASSSLLIITLLTVFIEFGAGYFLDPKTIFFLGFTQILPFSYIIYLIFWGVFARLFNLRQSKRLVGTVDLGAMFAAAFAFFSIPQFLKIQGIRTEDLYTVSLVAIFAFLAIFLFMAIRYFGRSSNYAKEVRQFKKLGLKDFIGNRYIVYMSLFVIVSAVAISFVDYTFLTVTTLKMDDNELASFLSYFELTVVVFGLFFQTFATDRFIREYGMRIPMLINPLLVGLFTIAAIILGFAFGYSVTDDLFIVFFLVIAVSRLFVIALRESLDEPGFKLYLLPIESNIRIDVQTKIEGIVMAFAGLLAGGLILLITKVQFFSLIYITIFTAPLLVLWVIVTNKMYGSYKQTLQNTLLKNKGKRSAEKDYTLNSVLEKEIAGSVDEKVIYGLKLMEKLEPALFETAIVRLAENSSPKVRQFASEKAALLNLEPRTEIRSLAEQAKSQLEDSDQLGIEPEKLLKISKSVKQADRILAARLLRKSIDTRTIFVLLELLRDADPKVRYEALTTARKVKRQEVWPLLIELLASPNYCHQAAAALKEAGESVLPILEAAFHKSGQSDLVMLRIVQIMGRIGGNYALQLLWRKADYPDKRIVKQILYSLRYINYRATGREARMVHDLLEAEMSKTLWNLAATHELPDQPEFSFLKEALREEVNENYNQITLLLSILYDPQSVQLVRSNIESGDPDNIAFALELMDIFVDQEIKPKLLPLFDSISIPEKLKKLQVYFPRETYNTIQVINYILNRDFNLNNRWTKACAIYASAYLPDFRISRGLVAQMFNTDKLLQETAAWVIYNKDRQVYHTIASRLPLKDKKYIDSAIENNRLLDGLNDGFYLWVEKVMFMKQLAPFQNIHGTLLCDLADKITPLDISANQTVRFPNDELATPVFILAHGHVHLKNNSTLIATLNRGDVFGEFFQEGNVLRITELEATERSIVFEINVMDFYFVMANHHEMVQDIIKNISTEREPNLTQPNY